MTAAMSSLTKPILLLFLFINTFQNALSHNIKRSAPDVTPNETVDADEIRDLGELFSELDLDNNGALNMNELISSSSRRQNPWSQRAFDTFDADGNGEFDLTEFIRLMSESDINKESQLQLVFEMIDVNGDGSIRRGDLMQVLMMASDNTLKKADIEPKVDKVFRRIDKDGDGKISLVELRLALGNNIVRKVVDL